MARSARLMSTNALNKPVNQVAHGFSVGQAIKFSGGVYALAQADTLANASVVGLVSYINDVDSFWLTQTGYIVDLTTGPYVANTTYYLSEITPGVITSVAPSGAGEYIRPVLYTDSTTSGYVFTTAPFEVGGGGGSGAPTTATYICQTSNGTLVNEQAMDALASGIVYNTTGTGVLSIAIEGTDYLGNPSIGVSVQGYADTLESISLLGTGAGKILYSTGVATWAEDDITAFSRLLLSESAPEDWAHDIFDGTAFAAATIAADDKVLIQDTSDSDTLKTVVASSLLAGAIGVTVQAYNANLQSISALGTAANKILYSTGVNTWAEDDITAFSRLLLSEAAPEDWSHDLFDGTTFSAVAVANDDKVLIQDTSDSDTLKTTTALEIVELLVKTGQTDVACNLNVTYDQNIETNQYFKLTFTSNCTLSFTFNAGLVQYMRLELIDAGSYAVTLPAMEWAGGAPPAFTAVGKDVIEVWNNGDDVIYATVIGQDFS